MSPIKKSFVRVKAAVTCFAYAPIIAMARVNGEPKYQSHWDGRGLKNLLKLCWKLPLLIVLLAENMKNFGSFKSTLRTTKSLYFTVWTPIGPCLVKIHFRLKINLLYDWDN